jgi:hypothetical protein
MRKFLAEFGPNKERYGYTIAALFSATALVYAIYAAVELWRGDLLPETASLIGLLTIGVSAVVPRKVPYVFTFCLSVALSSFIHGVLQIILTQEPGNEAWVTILGIGICVLCFLLASFFFGSTRRAVRAEEHAKQQSQQRAALAVELGGVPTHLQSQHVAPILTAAPPATRICPYCGVSNPISADKCGSCQNPIDF